MVGGESDRSGGGGGGGGRGVGGSRGRGRGRGGFSGSLSEGAKATASGGSRGGAGGGSDRGRGRGGGSGSKGKGRSAGGASNAESSASSSQLPASSTQAAPPPQQQRSVAPLLDAAPALDGETCFICAEPVKLYSVPPCNHKTCHICAIRLRVLYKKEDCTFCKAPCDNLIFTSETDKDYLSFDASALAYKDERLHIFFESEQSRDETLVLLHFNCPDATCEYAGASWPDLKAHVRAEHGKLFCDLCVRNSRIFVHEHSLYTSSEMTTHIRVDHKHCEFCRSNFYSDDELYVHMRDRHEQCFLCRQHEDRRDEYHRDYAALERHFRQRHILCDAKQCLEQKFVVFDSEMDFKAHQVAEHGTELSSREKRDALRLTANFHYNANNSSGGGPRRGDRGEANSGGSADEESSAVAASSSSRNQVPGFSAPANQPSRRAMFGSGLTNTNKIKDDEDATAQRAAAEEKARVTQAFWARVAEIVHHSDVKMHSFRTNLKIFEAGEMSARDLIASVQSIVEDASHVEGVVTGVLDVLERGDQKQDLLDAWSTLQVEQTHFPSLGGGSSAAMAVGGSSRGLNASLSTITRGQVRSIKNNSTAANRGVWANVERAAASGGSVYRNVARSTAPVARGHHFPSLGPNKKVIPGARIARSAGGTPWAGASAATPSSSGRGTPVMTTSATPSPSVKPFSVNASRSVAQKNQTSMRSNASSFPSLPVNAHTASITAQKKELFAYKRSNGNSGTGTPSVEAGPEVWARSGVGRIDGGGVGDLDASYLHERLGSAAQLSDSTPPQRTAGISGGIGGGEGASKKGKQQKKLLVSMGGVHRG